MKKTRIILTLLAVALASGLLFVSCPQEPEEENATFEGTWVYSGGGGYNFTYIFNNGTFEINGNGTSATKGTYTTSGSTLTMTQTHVWGPYAQQRNMNFEFEAKWYSVEEVNSKYQEENVNSRFGAEAKFTYSISGNTLTLTQEGDSPLTFTKQ